MQEAEKMSKELNFDGITQGLMDYESVGSAKGNAKKKKVAKKVAKKKTSDLPVIGISTNDDSNIKAPSKKGKQGKVAKKADGNSIDDDFELFENGKKLQDAEMMKDLNE